MLFEFFLCDERGQAIKNINGNTATISVIAKDESEAIKKLFLNILVYIGMIVWN
jgi:hypothetical protein